MGEKKRKQTAATGVYRWKAIRTKEKVVGLSSGTVGSRIVETGHALTRGERRGGSSPKKRREENKIFGKGQRSPMGENRGGYKWNRLKRHRSGDEIAQASRTEKIEEKKAVIGKKTKREGNQRKVDTSRIV